SLREFVDALIERRLDRLPARSLVITFDDGHRGNYELKSAIDEMNVPVAIFLCSGIVGSNRGFWFNHTQRPNEFKRLSYDQRIASLAAIGFDEHEDLADREALSRDEITDMMGELVDFQSHCVTHPILPSCTDAKARDEIERSRRELIEAYDLDIYALAYPN